MMIARLLQKVTCFLATLALAVPSALGQTQRKPLNDKDNPLNESVRKPVSSPRHVKRSGPISGTPLSCLLRFKGYVTYSAGSAFDLMPSRCTRYWLNRPSFPYSHCLLHLFQPKPLRF
jgi:hypothetical protein